jgi:hypothetical protein
MKAYSQRDGDKQRMIKATRDCPVAPRPPWDWPLMRVPFYWEYGASQSASTTIHLGPFFQTLADNEARYHKLASEISAISGLGLDEIAKLRNAIRFTTCSPVQFFEAVKEDLLYGRTDAQRLRELIARTE